MFGPGNKYGKGRPRIGLNKPELLLPIIFQKGGVNWANDFIRLYRAVRDGKASLVDKTQYKMYIELMPYLCTKVNVKELDFSKWGASAEEQKNMEDQTASLIKALEEINAHPKSTGPSKEAGMADGPSQIPPTA